MQVKITAKNQNKILACLNICKCIDFVGVNANTGNWGKSRSAIRNAEQRENFGFLIKNKIPFSVTFYMDSVYPKLSESEEKELEERNEPKNKDGLYICNFRHFTGEFRDRDKLAAAFKVLGITQDLITVAQNRWGIPNYELYYTDEFGNDVDEDDEDCQFEEWRIWREIEISFIFKK